MRMLKPDEIKLVEGLRQLMRMLREYHSNRYNSVKVQEYIVSS